MSHNVKANQKISLLFLFCVGFLIGCKGKIIDINKRFMVNYDTQTWEYITDSDDIKKLGKKMLQKTQLDLPDTSFAVELILLKPKTFKRKNIGVFSLKINIPYQDIEVIKKQEFFDFSNIKNRDWYTLNFNHATNPRTLELDNKKFFMLERKSHYKNSELRQSMAFWIENNNLYLFGIYSPEADFEKSSQEFLALLESINVDKNAVQMAIQQQQAGFFTGLAYGAMWLILWVFSWFHYIDVWPDNNSGFGFTLGFILGPILATFLRGFYNMLKNR